MILGKPINEIQKEDYLHRFLLLQKILEKYERKIGQIEVSLDDDSYYRYKKILKEREELQRLSFSFNKDFNNREIQSKLILDDIEPQYAKMNEMIKESSRSYEERLMKSWRDSIEIKKKKDDEVRRKKKLEGGSNKNLMFLTSQIFKRQRTGADFIENSIKELEIQIDSLAVLLKQEQQRLKQESREINSLILSMKQRNEIKVNQEKEQFRSKCETLLKEFDKLKLTIQDQIRHLSEKSKAGQEQIYQILEEIIAKIK